MLQHEAMVLEATYSVNNLPPVWEEEVKSLATKVSTREGRIEHLVQKQQRLTCNRG